MVIEKNSVLIIKDPLSPYGDLRSVSKRKGKSQKSYQKRANQTDLGLNTASSPYSFLNSSMGIQIVTHSIDYKNEVNINDLYLYDT